MNDKLAMTAEQLRRTFDESFAVAAETRRQGLQDFLAIRAGGERYAIRVSELLGLEGRRKTVPLPSRDPSLLGIAGAQGRLIPVYRLSTLVGGTGEEQPAWIAICGRDEPVGLAFAALDGHLRLPAADLYQPAKGERAYVREALRLASEVRYVLDVPAILAAVRDRAGVAALESRR